MFGAMSSESSTSGYIDSARVRSGLSDRTEGRAARHITRMFPAPLTSFAPTYMAPNEYGPGTVCNLGSGWKSMAFPWLGHVGNI